MTGKLVLVTGASGSIGPSLVNRLLAAGYSVRTYSRYHPMLDNSSSGVEFIQGDINDEINLAKALQGIDVVFHLAAMLHIENPHPQLTSLYQSVNVDGTQNILDQALRAKVKRLVYFSTVKVYGRHQLEPVDEDTKPTPKTFYAQTKLQAEKAVNAVKGIETVILRLSAVYGPRLRGSWARMVKAIERGWFIPIGNLQNQRSITYVDDVASAAIVAAEHPEAVRNTYNAVGHENATMREILTAIYSAQGKRMPPMRLPSSLLVPGAYALEKGLGLLGKRSPLPVETMQQLVSDEVYSGAKLRQLGFAPEFSLTESWRRTTIGMQKSPKSLS